MPRRFKPPWTAERIPGGYVVKDATGQALAYVYARDTKADADTAKVLTMDEARAQKPREQKESPGTLILSRGYSLGRERSFGTPTVSRGYDLDPFRYQARAGEGVPIPFTERLTPRFGSLPELTRGTTDKSNMNLRLDLGCGGRPFVCSSSGAVAAFNLGSGPGMGLATAERFAKEDYQIVLSARDAGKTQALAEQLRAKGHKVEVRTVDASNPSSIVTLIADVEEKFGAIDVLQPSLHP